MASFRTASFRSPHPNPSRYDQLNRLCSVRETQQATPWGQHNCGDPQGLYGGESWRQSFGYDRYGNQWAAQHLGDHMPYSGLRPTQQSNYNASTNRRVEVTNQLAYDAAGELTRHGAWNLVYDAEGRIRQSTNTGTSQTTDYAYDGAGNRVKKTVGTASTYFVYDAFGQLAAEYTSSGPSGTAATHYLTTDHLGSTRLVTDGSGAVVSRHDYLPFGEEAPSNLGGRSTSYGYLANASLTQRFTGKERDTETGLDYFGARYLSSPMGRFTSADAPFADQHVGDPQSWNLFSYVGNNPLRYVDPTGRSSERVICGANDQTCKNKETDTGVRKESNGDLVEDPSQSLRVSITDSGVIVVFGPTGEIESRHLPSQALTDTSDDLFGLLPTQMAVKIGAFGVAAAAAFGRQGGQGGAQDPQ